MVPLDQQFSPKLAPPRSRHDTIRRERLHQSLSDALESEVIVVSAPLGTAS
jgi:ATP/maltotriose-dependent transcriptional regulator MalT